MHSRHTTIRLATAVLAVALVLATTGTAALATSGPRDAGGPPACALGRLSPTDRPLLTPVLTAARTAFERSLHGVPSGRARVAGARFAVDLAAWLYGFPTVIAHRTIDTFPANAMVSIARLADTSTQTVVAPNHDTLYSVGRIDLTAGPIVIQTPPTHGRYSVIQLTDAFTNADAYLGDGAAARTGEAAVVVPRGWRGALPGGVRIVRPATNQLWLLGRTLATTPPDQRAAVALLSQYSVTRLQAWRAGVRGHPLVLPGFPAHRRPVMVPSNATFFDELGRDLSADPAPAADGCALAAFARAGIGPGLTPSRTQTGVQARALAGAARVGPAVVQRLLAALHRDPHRNQNGWIGTAPDTARFGTDYIGRAIVASIGLGANTVQKAIYTFTNIDSAGRVLDGRQAYRVRFAPGQLPPVRQFWSLTLYDQRILFYPNPLNRWAIGDRTAGLQRDRDGGLTIYVSHRPAPRSRRSNWLPAPAGPFTLYLRLYEPKRAAANGAWKPPAVVRVG